MRVFVTGATGFIGSAIVKELTDAGHEVTGLARSDASAKKLLAAGVKIHRGSIQDLESLHRGASNADGVIHTAFFHELSHMSIGTRLQVFLGGMPWDIPKRYLKAAIETDRRAIESMGNALRNTDRPLIAAFGTMGLKPGYLAIEDDAFDPSAAGGPRSESEKIMHSLSSQGVRTSVIRLAPLVHGAGDRSGLSPRLIQFARKSGISAYVGEGMNRWPAVHRLDAARLFRLALEQGSAGSTFHAVSEEGVPFRELAQVIAKGLNIPVISKTPEYAKKHFSWLSLFVGVDNPTSSKLTQDSLGWHPTQLSLIEDLEKNYLF